MFSCSVISNSLQPQAMQHASLPCPSPSLGVCSYSCPLSQWCHPTISSFVILFSSCPQYFPISESFPVSRLFTAGGQSIGASAMSLLFVDFSLFNLWNEDSIRVFLYVKMEKTFIIYLMKPWCYIFPIINRRKVNKQANIFYCLHTNGGERGKIHLS